jgi:uncharacterized protein involved in type VI secretion and phage assembly
MAFNKPVQDLQKPKLSDQFYLAKVISNNDPDKLGRVQVRINELHGKDGNSGIADSSLPYAMPVYPVGLGSGPNLGTFSVPRVGSQLLVTHLSSDTYQLAYFGTIYHAGTLNPLVQANYPNTYASIDSDGNYWQINLEANTLNVLFNGTAVAAITGDTTLNTTNLTINTSKNVTINTDSKTIVNAQAEVEVTSQTLVHLQAPLVKFRGGNEGVVTSQSINHISGLPHGDASTTVFASEG